jgi:hypothetical protein
VATTPHEVSSRRDEMFIARDWLKILSPLGSGGGHFREAMFFLVMRGAINIPLLRSILDGTNFQLAFFNLQSAMLITPPIFFC